MALQRVKKTADYSIYRRGDKRYAVKDASNKPVNGDEKVRILVEAGLLSAAAPAAPAEEAPAADESEAGEPAAEGDAG